MTTTSQNPIKASLKIILQAGDVVVAESENASLWQEILSLISNQATTQAAGLSENSFTNPRPANESAKMTGKSGSTPFGGATANLKLARDLGITPEILEAACNPSVDAPYLNFDLHFWEAFKKKTPGRGGGAISSTALAATLLCLWFKTAGIAGQPTIKNCQDVLETINVTDKNPHRSIKNASWLQFRNSSIYLNPAEISKAHDVAKQYCVKNSDSKAA